MAHASNLLSVCPPKYYNTQRPWQPSWWGCYIWFVDLFYQQRSHPSHKSKVCYWVCNVQVCRFCTHAYTLCKISFSSKFHRVSNKIYAADVTGNTVGGIALSLMYSSLCTLKPSLPQYPPQTWGWFCLFRWSHTPAECTFNVYTITSFASVLTAQIDCTVCDC